MKIGPVDEAGKLINTNGQPLSKSAQEAGRPEPPKDSLELSDRARQEFRAQPEGERLRQPCNLTVDNDAHLTARLQRIAKQIETGFYEQQAVREKTVERLMDDMLENIRDFYE